MAKERTDGCRLPTRTGDACPTADLRAHVAWLIDHSVHGLMPAGAAGKGPLPTTSECRQILEVVVDAAAGRVIVFAHIGAIATRGAAARRPRRWRPPPFARPTRR
ncbi:dihydrodipicolinate synthase family protein [Roseiflexus castenholzii]|uniref:dihydrodipicolinate synthase family protein n=1 Tax=Roseiflexus TaxID=120961 RepID=UPI000A034A86